jgi:hypothetical protein
MTAQNAGGIVAVDPVDGDEQGVSAEASTYKTTMSGSKPAFSSGATTTPLYFSASNLGI